MTLARLVRGIDCFHLVVDIVAGRPDREGTFALMHVSFEPVRSSMRRATTALIATALAAGGVAAAVGPAGEAAAATGCRVSYVVLAQWTTGFATTVTITNLGDPINGWTLRFAFPSPEQRVTQSWSATWSQSGQDVSAASLAWNAALGTNGSTMIGFLGAWSGSNPVPTAFTLNGVPCTGSVLPTPTRTTTTRPPIADFPPIVDLLQPTAGAVFTAPATIALRATATVGGGHRITNVTFIADGAPIATGATTSTSDGYQAQWMVPAGEPGTSTTYLVSVRASTSQGLTGGPAPILITVVTPPATGTNQPPAVSLTNPDRASFYLEPTTITLVADATDADPGDVINRAELYNGTTLIATSATNSGLHHQFPVALAAATSYTFRVRVYDSAGGVGISNPLGISVR